MVINPAEQVKQGGLPDGPSETTLIPPPSPDEAAAAAAAAEAVATIDRRVAAVLAGPHERSPGCGRITRLFRDRTSPRGRGFVGRFRCRRFVCPHCEARRIARAMQRA